MLAIAGLSQLGKGGSGQGMLGKVERGDLVQRVTVAGTIIPSKRTVLMPPYQGYIKKIYVKVGEDVRAGDPIISVVQSLNAVSEIFPMRAPFSGRVVQVLRTEGEWVDEKSSDAIMVRIDDISHLFVAGDGAGKSRGIVGAALNGVLAAEGILMKEGER